VLLAAWPRESKDQGRQEKTETMGLEADGVRHARTMINHATRIQVSHKSDVDEQQLVRLISAGAFPLGSVTSRGQAARGNSRAGHAPGISPSIPAHLRVSDAFGPTLRAVPQAERTDSSSLNRLRVDCSGRRDGWHGSHRRGVANLCHMAA